MKNNIATGIPLWQYKLKDSNKLQYINYSNSVCWGLSTQV